MERLELVGVVSKVKMKKSTKRKGEREYEYFFIRIPAELLLLGDIRKKLESLIGKKVKVILEFEQSPQQSSDLSEPSQTYQ